jgi:electron transport complex protein RnfE
MEITLIPDYRGFLLMALPPGGFLMMGFLMAAKRVADARISEGKQQPTAAPAVEAGA